MYGSETIAPWFGLVRAAVGLARAGAGALIRRAMPSLERAAANASNANRLGKALVSEQQIGEAGSVIAGRGSKTAFREAEAIARKYGGSGTDWVKKSSSTYTARDGTDSRRIGSRTLEPASVSNSRRSSRSRAMRTDDYARRKRSEML